MRPDPAPAALFLAATILAGCGFGEGALIPVTEVRNEPFEVRISALGELAAAQTTPIKVPTALRGRQRIAWIATDSKHVEEGELVARLDADSTDQRLTKLRNRLSRLDFRLAAKQQELTKEREEIESRLRLLAQEQEDALATAPRDERMFSRQEIIDAQVNLDLIETKIAHFTSRRERADEKERNELQILHLQRETEQVQIDQLESARLDLEVLAPHDGFFSRGTTRQGEKLRVGMELWAGQRLGELPDLREMEAKVWVLEAEAAGLAEGLETRVTLDAHPDSSVAGRVKSIDPIANPIEEDSPVKYFEVTLSLERTEPEVMKPASQVQVTILVTREDSVLAVPNQAIFVEGGEPWVYVEGSQGFERRRVELGQRSVSRTVISAGLVPGERIALVSPAESAEGDS